MTTRYIYKYYSSSLLLFDKLNLALSLDSNVGTNQMARRKHLHVQHNAIDSALSRGTNEITHKKED